MRLIAGSLGAIACLFVYGACAGGEDGAENASTPAPDSGTALPGNGDAEAGADRDADAPKDASVDAQQLFCSDAGWCETRFPDDTLAEVFDLLPVDGTVFAARNGVEQYDGTKWISLTHEGGGYTIWAPNANEVWSGDILGGLVHGVQSGGTWTWTPETLGVKTSNDFRIESLWGTGPDDVYASVGQYASKLFHRRPSDDGGPPEWVLEYESTTPPNIFNNDQFRIWQVTGTGPDDVWVLASRGTGAQNCSTLIHKSHGEYKPIADCTTPCNPDTGTCLRTPIPGLALIPEGFTRAGFILPNGTLISTNAGALSFAIPMVQTVRLLPTGEAEITRNLVSGAGGVNVWGLSETDLYSSGWYLLTHSSNALTDGGTFSISTLVLNGAPLTSNFKIRGTSASDIWVYGGMYALHNDAAR